MKQRFASVLLLAGAAFSGVAAAACDGGPREGLGPVMVRSESPAQVLRMTPMPRNPYLLCSGEHQLRAMSSVVAVWSKSITPPTYLFDYEMLDTHVALAGGLHGGWAYEVSYDDRRPVDIGLRHVVIAFHDAFGMSNDGRDQMPTGETIIRIPSYGVNIDGHGGSLLARSFQFTLSRQLSRGPRWWPITALSATVRKAMVSDSPFENGVVDYSGELSMALPLREDFIYADLAYTSFGTDHIFTVPMTTHQFVGMFGYQWTLNSNSALIGQYLYSEGVVKDMGDLSKPSHELYLGYKRQAQALTWEVGLIENLAPYNNSPDFGLSFGLVYDL